MSRYKIIWDTEHDSMDLDIRCDSLEEIKPYLDILHDIELDTAKQEGLNVDFEWDEDGCGFTVYTWTGDNKDTAEDYFYKTYRVSEKEDTEEDSND